MEFTLEKRTYSSNKTLVDFCELQHGSKLYTWDGCLAFKRTVVLTDAAADVQHAQHVGRVASVYAAPAGGGGGPFPIR